MRSLSLLALLAILALMTGCATTNQEALTPTKSHAHEQPRQLEIAAHTETEVEELHYFNGKPYYVESTKNYQYGQASWYGHAFQGRRTASGERFNQHAMTAAHSTLPLPSYLRVTNLHNGKSVIVRVNDRLPPHKTRVVDLSYAAAKKIDMHRAGVVNVKIEQVYLTEK